MIRLRRRSAGREGTSHWWRGSRHFTLHPERSLSDADAEGLPSISAASQPVKQISAFLAFWPNRSSPSVSRHSSDVSIPPDISVEVSTHEILKVSGLDYAQHQCPKVRKPRLPRYIPIIIPDFAQPFDPRPSSTTSTGETSAILETTPISIPQLQGAKRTPLKANAWTASSTSNISINPVETDSAHETNTRMNNSEVSLVASEPSVDGTGTAQPAIASGGNVGISPVVNQQNSGPTNLSGLVCNVHRTTGSEPHALVGATTTILGDKLYVFGGRIHSRKQPLLTSDLYELDLIRRHWTKVETIGDIPPPRYFHSVCALGDSKLVCYGGMSPAQHIRNQGSSQNGKASSEPQPEVQVMSDIHVFDVPTRTWTLISTSDNHPQGRYAHCAAILPSSAVFTSANAPLSAIHHNPSSSDPHSGTLGVQLDGTGGTDMVVVGGQDSANAYIEQISVFNLRSLKWTSTTSWDRKCGAYKSMVAPMTGLAADLVSQNTPPNESQGQKKPHKSGTPMLIYSNYNFLDVKLELQIRLPDGTLVERPMNGPVSPPGLRFPNGGIIDNHFVVSGTYLTSSKHEYALWALDLKNLTWGRIDTNGSVFSQGSWNRGILWNRRNTFVILGHRKRSLVDDYNHRRINFSHVCMVELEAFGLYDNPRKTAPTSGYISVSSPAVPLSLQSNLPSHNAGGRPYTNTAEQLGQAALSISELSDMELVAMGGERIPCNSHILSRRWGPYFTQLLMESTASLDTSSLSDAATLRPYAPSQTSRNSSITITPSVATAFVPSAGGPQTEAIHDPQRSLSRLTARTIVDIPNPTSVPASARPRSLYLPHTLPTIQLLLHYLYASSLPPIGAPLCTPHTLCSLLQMARPYQVDGLLEATVERLHEVLDGRNAAAVFNAAAMAAGGGQGLGGGSGGTLETLGRQDSEVGTTGDNAAAAQAQVTKTAKVKVTPNVESNGIGAQRGHVKTESLDSGSTATSNSTSTDFSHTDTESSTQEGTDENGSKKERDVREIWTGDVSSVIGLQKRGLRGLMEGRRLRERANTLGSAE